MIAADPDDPDAGPRLRLEGAITCSIGIATLQSDVLPDITATNSGPERAKDELLRRADTCMYAAKELGKDRVEVFDPRMQARITERLHLVNDLRRAIDEAQLEELHLRIID